MWKQYKFENEGQQIKTLEQHTTYFQYLDNFNNIPKKPGIRFYVQGRIEGQLRA